jgi:hypothetical protein
MSPPGVGTERSRKEAAHAQMSVLHMEAPRSSAIASSRASVSPAVSLCSTVDSRRLGSRRRVAFSHPRGAPAVTAVDPRTQCALVCYVKSISCKPGRLACMAFSCKIVAKESTGFNRCPLQVVENTDPPQGGIHCAQGGFRPAAEIPCSQVLTFQ